MTEYGEGCVAIPGILWLQKWFAGSLDMQLEVWNDSEPEEQRLTESMHVYGIIKLNSQMAMMHAITIRIAPSWRSLQLNIKGTGLALLLVSASSHPIRSVCMVTNKVSCKESFICHQTGFHGHQPTKGCIHARLAVIKSEVHWHIIVREVFIINLYSLQELQQKLVDDLEVEQVPSFFILYIALVQSRDCLIVTVKFVQYQAAVQLLV